MLRRLLGRAFQASAIFSALWGLALSALWVRSYWHFDRLGADFARQSCSIDSGDGVLLVQMTSSDFPGLDRTLNLRTTALAWDVWDVQRDDRQASRFGSSHRISVERYQRWRVTTHVRMAWLPHWSLALATLVLPVAYAARQRTAYRLNKPGRCAACGYDLRATPQGPEAGGALLDRCPECGTVPHRPPARR